MNGPGATVAGGMVFVSSGYGSLGFMPGNVLLAFSVDGRYGRGGSSDPPVTCPANRQAGAGP